MFSRSERVQAQAELKQKVLNTFVLSLLIGTIGMCFGQYIPQSLMLPLAIVEIILVVVMVFSRKNKGIGYMFLYAITFISGITIYPAINYYLSTVGADTVLAAFLTTVGIFIVMAVIGNATKKDLFGLGAILNVVLWGIIIVMVVGLFIPFSSTLMLVISCVSAIVFSLYVLYDFNQMSVYGIEEEDIPYYALSLYLDFVNLFLHLLRIFAEVSSED